MPNIKVLIVCPMVENEIDIFKESYPDFEIDYKPLLRGTAARQALVTSKYDAVIIGSGDPFTETHFGDTLQEWRNAKGQNAKLAIIRAGSQPTVNITAVAKNNIALMTTPKACAKDVVTYTLTKLPQNIAIKTVAVIGTGTVAKILIEELKKRGCKYINAWSPNFSAEQAKKLGVIYCKTAKDACIQADILTIQTHYFSVAHGVDLEVTMHSENLIGENEINELSHGAKVINVSAHELINKNAFCDAVRSGKIESFHFNVTQQSINELKIALPGDVQAKGQFDLSTHYYSIDTKINLAKMALERVEVYFNRGIAIDALLNSHQFTGGAKIIQSPAQQATRMPVKSITFIGSGRVAQFLAASLARANYNPGIKLQISILGRRGSKNLEAIKKNGITCKNPQRIHNQPFDEYHIASGDALLTEVFVTDNPHEIVKKFGKQSYIFVVTKTYAHTEELVKTQINPLRENDSAIVLLQSGIPSWFLQGAPGFEAKHLQSIDPDGKFLRALSPNKIIGCMLDHACRFETDDNGISKIVSTNFLSDIQINICTLNRESILPIFFLRDTVFGLHLGMKMRYLSRHIKVEFLRKIQIDLPLNALTTLFGCKVGELLTETRLPLVRMLAYEVEIFAKNTLQHVDGLHTRESLEESIKNYSDQITPMRDDFMNGKKLEIDSLLTVIPELHNIAAQKTGDTPLDLYFIKEITKFLNAVDQKSAITDEIKIKLNELMVWAKAEEEITKSEMGTTKAEEILSSSMHRSFINAKTQPGSWSKKPEGLIPTLSSSEMYLPGYGYSIYPDYNRQPRAPVVRKICSRL